MHKARFMCRLMALLTVGGTLMGGACLPDNYWAGKWGEVINRGIFGVINAVLAAATGGDVQV